MPSVNQSGKCGMVAPEAYGGMEDNKRERLIGLIKRECKQCGKQFTLSDSEIKFYKSKNLTFPKRCKECRESNKKGNDQKNGTKDINVKLEEIVNSIDSQTLSAAAELIPDNIRKRKYGKVLIPVILVAAAALVIVFVSCRNQNNGSEQTSVNNAVTEISIYDESVSEDITTALTENRSESGALSAETESSEDISATMENGSESEIVSSEPAVSDVPAETTESEDKNTEKEQDLYYPEGSEDTVFTEDGQGAGYDSSDAYVVTFRNSKLLNEHYEKHGKEMGFADAAEYEKAAAAVVNSPDALHKNEKEDGDDIYYIEETNDFVVVSTDGYIRTYFWPSAGKKYYDKQ